MELLNQYHQEKIDTVAREGVTQPGKVVPDAEPNPKDVEPGALAEPITPSVNPGLPSRITPAEQAVGAVADPRTGVPQLAFEAKIKSVEMFAAQTATPSIMQAAAGAPAEVKEKAYEVTAQVTPRTQVTVVVPPAFPLDPQSVFAAADESMEDIPPAEPPMKRDLIPDPVTEELESTEAYVARSFQMREGDWNGRERDIG